MPNQVIYPSSGSVAYVLLLVFVKCLRTIGLFLSYGVLKTIHVVEFLFLVKIGAAFCMVVLQKPFKSNQKLSRQQWARVVRHALFNCLINLLWLYGLTQCGTLRTNLVYEHSETVVLAGTAALFTSSGSPAKTRAAVFFLVGVISLLLFDHDDIEIHHKTSDHQHHNGISHLFYHFANWMDVADHKVGVALLFVTLCLNVGFSTVAKKLAVDVGGAKRLQTLSTLVSVVILLPLVLVLFVTQQSSIKSWPLFVIPLALIIVFVFIMNYYVESLCATKLDASTMARVGAVSSFVSALVISFFWRYGLTEIDSRTGERRVIVRPEHPLSGGVIFALLVFVQATYTLSGPQSVSSRGTFIGYSAAGLPLYHLNSASLQKSSESIMKILRNGLRQILEEQDSRQIFYFLCINLMFTFVELIYGVWANSLGLISDGFHMLFDCSALVMGLYAAVMSRWKATRIFSYGYGRVEILSGFVNGLFLVVIALFVFVEAWGRLINPPEILTERLLSVAVIGLIVNLIGVFAFSHAHGGSHGHSHGGSHSHSGGHGHSHHHGHSHEKAKINTNMQGVFLHVMADTLGSVGVILSTLLIENFGWYIADPICSLFIASTIFFSVLPLLRDTSLMLLLRTPAGREKEITQALDMILHIHGVLAYRDEHFWNHSSNTIACTLHVQVAPDAVEQQVRNQAVKILRSCGVSNISVQVEKEEYYQHMSGLSSSFQRLFKEAHDVHLLNVNSSHYQELVKEV